MREYTSLSVKEDEKEVIQNIADSLFPNKRIGEAIVLMAKNAKETEHTEGKFKNPNDQSENADEQRKNGEADLTEEISALRDKIEEMDTENKNNSSKEIPNGELEELQSRMEETTNAIQNIERTLNEII